VLDTTTAALLNVGANGGINGADVGVNDGVKNEVASPSPFPTGISNSLLYKSDSS
jgi:hypothetical protein